MAPLIAKQNNTNFVLSKNTAVWHTEMESQKAVTAYLKSEQSLPYGDGFARQHGQQQPSKHGAFTQCCFNVGPASKTVPNIETALGECPMFAGKALANSGFLPHMYCYSNITPMWARNGHVGHKLKTAVWRWPVFLQLCPVTADLHSVIYTAVRSQKEVSASKQILSFGLLEQYTNFKFINHIISVQDSGLYI